ncbi:MAG TPA: sodium-independent anion transporter, partial [Pseudohongiella sp.]|nr:sodium-independent anion transporter [Pseudohongiella sp.]
VTAAAVARLELADAAQVIAASTLLAMMAGLFLVLLGLLRLGFLANFLSHPVIAGFITASGVIIALGQLPGILGIQAGG